MAISRRFLPFLVIIIVAGGMALLGYIAERDTHCEGASAPVHAQPCPQCDDIPPKMVSVPEHVTVYRESPADPHDVSEILKRMRYWKSSRYSRQIESTGKYLLIDRDCGGFNNIRMAFEYHIIWAWLTHRTLVLPPVVEWYLLDFGPIKSLAADGKKVVQGGVSKFSDYFDMTAVRGAVPVMSHLEFWGLPRHQAMLPQQFRGSPLRGMHERLGYFRWLYNESNPLVKKVYFSGYHQFLYWPSKAAVEASGNAPDASFVDNRKGTEVTKQWLEEPVLYYPNCEDNMKYRSLTQVAVAVSFADDAAQRAMLSLLRDNVHFTEEIFALAAEGVAQLGMHKYSALHVRRNDLQYKEVFMESSATIDNIKPLVDPNEVLYIATDETDPKFFEAIERSHKVVRLQDLTVFPKIRRRLLGMVELVICCMGRRFFGTQHSTFTSYIHRLRGYMKAPDTSVYFHTFKYTGNKEADAKLRPPQVAHNYKEEFDLVWQLIQED